MGTHGTPGAIVSWRNLFGLVLLSACLAAPSAARADLGGVSFSERLSVGTAELRLHGTGLLRYAGFLKGYAAALYLDDAFVLEATTRSVLQDVPRRIEIEYFWSIPARMFADATVEGIRQNTDDVAFETLRDRIDRLNALYEDVEPGDRYALTYLPGVGTELALNGRSLGLVEGADFSRALFAIWLGHEPFDESLRRQLLARN